MLPFLYSDPDASEESTGSGAAVAEEQPELFPTDSSQPDTPDESQGPAAPPSEDSIESESHPQDAGEFVGLRQTAQQDTTVSPKTSSPVTRTTMPSLRT